MTTERKKPSARDVLRSLEDTSIDDEIERVLAMTPDERRAELRQAGYDVEREIDAKVDAALGKAPSSAIVRAPARPPLRKLAAWWAEAVALAAFGAVAYVAQHAPVAGLPLGEHLGPQGEPQGAAAAEVAAKLRAKALAECDDGRWLDCLDDLDEAKERDPAGDRAARIVAARALAEERLQEADGDAGAPAPAPTWKLKPPK